MTTDTASPLRQRMIEDMTARKLCAGTQRGHIRSCKRFAAFPPRHRRWQIATFGLPGSGMHGVDVQSANCCWQK